MHRIIQVPNDTAVEEQRDPRQGGQEKRTKAGATAPKPSSTSPQVLAANQSDAPSKATAEATWKQPVATNSN